MRVQQTFRSKRNRVRLIEENNRQYVEKKFTEAIDYITECDAYRRLAQGGFLTPTLLANHDKHLTIHLEYVEGRTLLEWLEHLEREEKVEEAVYWLINLYEIFKALNSQLNYQYVDVNLRNFIIRNDALVLLDFEQMRQGVKVPLAKTLAYYLLYDPVKTDYKWAVVHQCLACLKEQDQIQEVEAWMERIRLRRHQTSIKI